MPSKTPDGKYVFTLPLDDVEMVFIHLEDYGRYVEWMFRNPARSASLDLGIALAHVSGQDIADVFTATTNQPAVYQNVSFPVWAQAAFGAFPNGPDTKVGFRSGKAVEELNMSSGKNFQNIFKLSKASKGHVGLIRRDYELLDEILPERVKSVKGWMMKIGYSGERIGLLKECR